MPRVVRPSERRISTLDTIQEVSSDSIGCQRLSLVEPQRRVSVGFSVNIPVNERPKRRFSEATAVYTAAEPFLVPKQSERLSEARQSLLEQRRSMVRSASNRFRQSLYASPNSPWKPVKRRKKISTKAAPLTDISFHETNGYIPSYARPTAASMAKAKKPRR